MEPVGSIRLHTKGNDKERIGPNVRNTHIPDTKHIEEMIRKVCPLAITCDVKQIHPPFFTEFTYQDTLSGIGINTLSAEVSIRMTEEASKMEAVEPFPLKNALDKYHLDAYPHAHKKVVFLCGSNAMHFVNQSEFIRLVREDEEWVIKPHPVTNDNTLRELASVVGYHRIIHPKVSGMNLLKRCEQIATVSTSEMYLIARLMNIPVINLTNYDMNWLTCYHRYVRLLNNTDNDITVLNNALMSELSGYLHPGYSPVRNERLAKAYFQRALEIREQFRMVCNQKLTVSPVTINSWNQQK